jgi:hypothetical protein
MRDFRVHSLDAKYVGPFERLFIEFKEKVIKDEAEVHIFTGENGTGKSTILYMLALNGCQNERLIMPRIRSSFSHVFYYETKYSFNSGVYIPSATYNYSSNGFMSGGENSNGLSRYFASISYPDDIRFKHPYSFALFAYSGYRKIDSPKLESIKEITGHPLADALDFHSSINPQTLLQWIANTQSREALALARGRKEDANRYKLSLEKLQIAISNIIGDIIEFKLIEKPFDVFVVWNGVQMTFEVLPDGLKSIISWLGDLIMRLDRIEWETEMDIFDRNFILFLDEIDIHLHAAWQRKILPVIKRLFKNAQIFVSTHSPFVVGSVDGAWVYKLKKEGQYAVLDGEPVLSEDAKSYRLILEEIFGIKEQFGENVEKKLQEFYALRKEILENKRPVEDETFQNIIDELAPQSIELESILAMELRQLERIKKLKHLQPTL